MNKIATQFACFAVLILLIWFLSELVGDALNHVILSCIAGWQLGDWAYKLGDRLTQ